MTKEPQDHKPKQDQPKQRAFRFTGADGETYELPPVEGLLEQLDGYALEDAVTGGDEGQLRLGFKLLGLDGIEDAARHQLKSLSLPKMADALTRWQDWAPEDGVNLGKSQGSSD